jgi:hypothetical protein
MRPDQAERMLRGQKAEVKKTDAETPDLAGALFVL